MTKNNLQRIKQEYKDSKKVMDDATIDFQKLKMLIDGIPIHHDSDTPYVADTTLAGLVRTIPRTAIEQLPVFNTVVNGSKNNQQSHICNYILRDRIFNEDTFGKGLLSTLQMSAEIALTNGFAPLMVSVGNLFNEFGTSMRLLHYSDVALEPGVTDASEAKYFFMIAHLTKTRIKSLIKSASKNKNTTWNVKALKKLLESEAEEKEYSLYMNEAEEASYDKTSNTYTIITKYEAGKNGTFTTFSNNIDEPLRVIKNNSKFGYPRVMFLVIDPAPLSPFGLSRVRLASPNQNILNIFYQNVSSMLILNAKPPVLQRGRFAGPVQLRQGARWVAKDQNAQVELKELSNSSLQQFVPFSQQMSSQIQNMMGHPTGTVNGGSNSFGFSKTSPGVKMQEKYMNTTISQITNLLENFLRQYALVALDTYISENSGESIIIIDDEAKDSINRLAETKFEPTNEEPEFIPPIGDDNRFKINWEEFYEGIQKWSVKIELSISKDELDEKKRGDLQDMITVLSQNAQGNPEAMQKVNELTDMLLEKSVPESRRMKLQQPQPKEQPQLEMPNVMPNEEMLTKQNG